MRLLLCHNYYKLAGGEDRCYEDEGKLLESHGHYVLRYEKRNDHISGLQQVQTAGQSIWNQQTVNEIRQLIRDHKIDLVHCTNSFPVISPSLYYACEQEHTPIVQSLHNFRLFCANSFFLRDGKVCESCVSRLFPWPAITHRCYRDSRVGSTVVATMQWIHHRVGTWNKKVTRFIALTDFSKQKYIECGLPEELISIKPNFLDPLPQVGTGASNEALFVGRLSPEKGVDLLLEAWESPACNLTLNIVGDGPLRDHVVRASSSNAKIKYLGKLPSENVLKIMSEARFLIVPSVWYEGLPRTIVESLAVGTPILASEIGSLTDLVREGAGGTRFVAGNVASLIETAAQMCRDDQKIAQMRVEARSEFLDRYVAQKNYETLIGIYNQTIAEHLAKRRKK